jgi:hypothetical protein
MRLTTSRCAEFAPFHSQTSQVSRRSDPHSENDNLTRRISVTVSKLPEPKSDNGRQRQTTKGYRIPPIRRMGRRESRKTPPERVLLSCVLSRFGIRIDRCSFPRQLRPPKPRPRETLSTRNRCGDLVNFTRRPATFFESLD